MSCSDIDIDIYIYVQIYKSVRIYELAGMRTFPKYRNQAAIKMKSHVSHETAWVQAASSGISLRQAFVFGSAACDTTSFCLVSHKFKQHRFKARVSRGVPKNVGYVKHIEHAESYLRLCYNCLCCLCYFCCGVFGSLYITSLSLMHTR